MKTIFVCLALLATSPAFAAPAPKIPDLFCPDASPLFEEAANCMDNREFVDAAETCLERLENAVKSQTAAAKAGLKGDKGSKQAQNFSVSNKDYKFTSVNFDYLVKLAKQAGEEVDGYQDWMLLPDDAEGPELEKYPCYAEARDSIKSVLKDVHDIEKELQAAKDIADAHAATSGSHTSSLTTIVPTDTGEEEGESAPAPAHPKAKVRESDISGTEKEKKKK